MAQDPVPNLNQPIPLSQAHAVRARRDSSSRIETSEDTLRQILSEVVDEKVSAKITRLETSINRMVDHMEDVRTGEAEDAALRVTADSDAADLALASIDLSPEDFYCYTCGMLAEKLNIKSHYVLSMIKHFNLRGDLQFHRLIPTGIKSSVNKWSEATYLRLKKAIDSGEYSVPLERVK